MKNHNANYEFELEVAKMLSEQAAQAIMGYFRRNLKVTIKSDNTPVTNADIHANEIIVAGLQHYFPADGIVSEELADKVGKRTWYVDPIDGTESFSKGSTEFAIHIGLVEETEPVLGIVHRPATHELYYAIQNQGAYKISSDGIKYPLKVDASNQNGTVLVVSKRHYHEQASLDVAAHLRPANTIIHGSEGLRIMHIAEGTGNVHYSNNRHSISTWDVCAPQIIVAEAAGIIKYANGDPIRYHTQRSLGEHFIVASSLDLFTKTAELIHKYM